MEKKQIVLCDTNILIRYFKGDTAIINELDNIGFRRLAISTVTAAEMYFGMHKNEIRETKELINKFSIFDIDKNVSKRFLEIVFEHQNHLSLADALIAATAIENAVQLYTLNIKDFDFLKDIKLYKPKLKR
jgi:tRNA(fMet)-specific endonuclease VapC